MGAGGEEPSPLLSEREDRAVRAIDAIGEEDVLRVIQAIIDAALSAAPCFPGGHLKDDAIPDDGQA